MFLGAGYHITAAFVDSNKVAFGKDAVLNILRSRGVDAELQSTAGVEATFLVSTNDRSKFPELFAQLENAKEELGIESLGVSVTTMEEVFLKYEINFLNSI